jgi:hypothetical protein
MEVDMNMNTMKFIFLLINFVKDVRIVVDDSIGHCESVPMILLEMNM